MSLQTLAQRSGVSAGMLSQIERGLANPSLRLLTGIRHALGAELSELFQETATVASDPDFVRRASARPSLELGYLRKELLSAHAHHDLQFMILHLGPHGSSGEKPLSYPAEKGGLVLSGQLILSVGEKEALLEEGDSFSFDSSVPHRFQNPAASPARVLWIIGAVPLERHL